MNATALAPEPTLTGRTRDVLKRAGNPFRNYFARNPDDEVCARFHVPELFAAERDLLHAIIDLYRYDPQTHSEVVPILGNKGAGKTHLLHSIKHGVGGQWQLLVTPGVYQRDSDFLEYLLFQIIDTLLGGGKQKGVRPLDFIGDQLVRRQLGVALRELSDEEKVELFPPPGLGRWARRLGLGTQQARERAEWLAENLSGYSNFARMPTPIAQALTDAGLTPQKAFDLVCTHIQKNEAHNTAGLMRRHIFQGFAKAALLRDESELANFLTYGFAELEFHVRPTRQDLVLALFKVLTEVFRSLKTPVVVAFDQLEDLLLARRTDDAHRTAEAFFAGIVQVMHQIDGLCFLIFAERGLWNRFVPSLDGYIQDRLNNPVHVPKHGTVKAIRLEAPPADLVRRVVEARLRSCLGELPAGESVSEIFPFVDEQITRIARTEPTLRDMLQQFRHLFDHVVYGPDDAQAPVARVSEPTPVKAVEVELIQPDAAPELPAGRFDVTAEIAAMPALPAPVIEPKLPELPVSYDPVSRIAALLGRDEDDVLPPLPTLTIKHVEVIEAPAEEPPVAEVVSPAPLLMLPPAVTDDVPMAVAVDLEEIVEESITSSELVVEVQEPPALPVVQAEAPTVVAAAPEVPAVAPFPSAVPANVSPATVVKPAVSVAATAPAVARDSHAALVELWEQEQRAARRKLEPEGALTGATRELQAGLGAFLSVCHEHGVKVGPWRLQHVVNEWSYGEHPTYGVVTIAHWACKDAQPWRMGLGLFLARGAGKPKDLEVKLAVLDTEPAVVDLLVLLRPEDDIATTGKSKTLLQDAERRGKHTRLEPVSLDGFAQMYAFPRWLAAVRESLPEGAPLPNLADIIQEKGEKLLEQVCMPVQG
ncbi:Uncharacterized protein OS=Candidatus Entotheonella sp. TSY2 GN=ETSY2_22110 PE=4 SV=1 [Gemmata massiliana]|uniref:Uncharacterized protein n=1 Tax=Gemmata massiliana TaxID=1210884 RepID=A0A6P2CRI3_9BACT|nr:hypothetical protein [Gemmata massiliana]VTR91519.1 Uncharacterized protein OS=Candidatus Entotheonella sp. TSY2 GN=ETSY2_22110 PE=4 SV=1 [Gemmata massiliana]